VSSSSPRDSKPLGRRGRGRNALVAWAWILGLCLAALIATYLLFVEPPPPHKIIIASGGKDGAYYRYARRYAEELRKEGMSVEVRETAGSVENLRLLGQDGSGVAVAIAQGGVAGPEEIERFQALGSLYREPLWVFYRGDERLENLGQLAGKRIGTGPPGSGTYAVAMQLMRANGLVDSPSSGGASRTVLVREDVASAAKALQDGGLDAAFFVAAFEAEYIQGLLKDGRVKLLGFDQQEAYHRRFRFLAPVTLPAGIVDLGRNIPARDVALLAPTAMLVVRKDFHPALVPLVLAAATRIHGKGDEVSDPGEFPSESYCDFPVSEDARRFYKSGQPVLQRLLPFWMASLVDRTKVMLIPLVMLMMPLLRTAPPLMRWRTRRKIYLWYSDLREIDHKLVAGLSGPELEQELARLKDIERQVAHVDVPLSYMEEFYHLRMHIALLQHLAELRARGEPSPSASESHRVDAPLDASGPPAGAAEGRGLRR
jgi:TRAP transporter TAXI family solute receptor